MTVIAIRPALKSRTNISVFNTYVCHSYMPSLIRHSFLFSSFSYQTGTMTAIECICTKSSLFLYIWVIVSDSMELKKE